jgi:hypothetical protein
MDESVNREPHAQVANNNNNNNNNGNSNTNSNTNNNANSNLNGDPVLARLKELEDSNRSNAQKLEHMHAELKEKEDRIKNLSADKRKEMESILSTAIDKWLNSLAGVSDENKANFRQGICKLAERADMNNAAWEIVCHASQTHQTNVCKIEELLVKTQQQEQEIGDLKGFRNEASRISGHKRGREDPPPTTASSSVHKEEVPQAGKGNNNTWDLFETMISRDFKTQYF